MEPTLVYVQHASETLDRYASFESVVSRVHYLVMYQTLFHPCVSTLEDAAVT